jgi:hypothetical protein
MSFRSLAAIVSSCVMLTASLCAIAADRGPSTPEERKQALDYAQDYLSNPLGPNARQEREWVAKWATEVPDVHVSLCVLLEKQPKGNKQDADSIFAGIVLAQTAFAIQNPAAKANSVEAYLAGINGALHVYELLLKDRPKDRQPYMDDLIQKREAGSLQQFVQERAAKSCTQ